MTKEEKKKTKKFSITLQVCEHCSYRNAKEYQWQNKTIILAADFASNGIYNFLIPLRAHFKSKTSLNPIILLLERRPDIAFLDAISYFPLVNVTLNWPYICVSASIFFRFIGCWAQSIAWMISYGPELRWPKMWLLSIRNCQILRRKIVFRTAIQLLVYRICSSKTQILPGKCFAIFLCFFLQIFPQY